MARVSFRRNSVLLGLSLAAALAGCSADSDEPDVRQDVDGVSGRLVIEPPGDGIEACSIINAAIADAPEGSVVELASGRFLCDSGLLIDRKRALTLQGSSATDKAVLYVSGPTGIESTRRHVRIVDSHEITLWNLRIEGANEETGDRAGYGSYVPDYRNENGIEINRSEFVTVADTEIIGVFGDGVHVGGPKDEPNDVLLRRVTIDRNGNHGVFVAGVEGLEADQVHIEHTRKNGFHLQPMDSSVQDLDIHHSSVHGYSSALATGTSGVVRNVTFANNTVSGPGIPWVYVTASVQGARSGILVANNVIMNPEDGDKPTSSSAELVFERTDSIMIDSNASKLSELLSRLAIQLTDTNGPITIINNDFKGACTLYEPVGSVAEVTEGNNTLSRNCM